MSCNCYSATIPENQANFTVKAGLTDNTEYRWTLIDKFGNRLNGTATTDSTGAIVVADSSLPNLMMNFSGTFNLQFFQGSDMVASALTICSQTGFDCIEINCYRQTGTVVPAIIGQCE